MELQSIILESKLMLYTAKYMAYNNNDINVQRMIIQWQVTDMKYYNTIMLTSDRNWIVSDVSS